MVIVLILIESNLNNNNKKLSSSLVNERKIANEIYTITLMSSIA
jgi:hypothetical protein